MHNYDYLMYDSSKKRCVATFQEDTNANSKYWILGDSYLRSYYTIYDMDKMIVGLAGERIDLGPSVYPDNDSYTFDEMVDDIKDYVSNNLNIILPIAGFLGLMILFCWCKSCKRKGQCCWPKPKP